MSAIPELNVDVTTDNVKCDTGFGNTSPVLANVIISMSLGTPESFSCINSKSVHVYKVVMGRA